MRQSLVSFFQNAIRSPQDHFMTLWQKIDLSRSDRAVVDWGGQFAEVRIYIFGQGYAMLYMPLKQFKIEISAQLERSDSFILSPYRIYRDELVFYDNCGVQHSVDVMVQHIAGGCPLLQSGLEISEMLEIVGELERECRRIGFSHNHLTPFDVMLSPEHKPYLVRYHYATFGGAMDNFDAIRSTIHCNQSRLSDSEAVYTVEDCYMYDSCHCGLVRFRRGRLCGYKDNFGEVVIDAKYLWAGEFYENRAVVRTSSGYGVIDIQQRTIVEPIYPMLHYNTTNTFFYAFIVQPNGQREVVAFDYNGTPIKADDIRLKDILDGI